MNTQEYCCVRANTLTKNGMLIKVHPWRQPSTGSSRCCRLIRVEPVDSLLSSCKKVRGSVKLYWPQSPLPISTCATPKRVQCTRACGSVFVIQEYIHPNMHACTDSHTHCSTHAHTHPLQQILAHDSHDP